MSHDTLTFSGGGGSWWVEGELDCRNAAELHGWSRSITATETIHALDMAALEILDAAGIAAIIEVIRQISQHGPLLISHAPHLLAHTLYRVGMLEGRSHIILVEPRQEEPYG